MRQVSVVADDGLRPARVPDGVCWRSASRRGTRGGLYRRCARRTQARVAGSVRWWSAMHS